MFNVSNIHGCTSGYAAFIRNNGMHQTQGKQYIAFCIYGDKSYLVWKLEYTIIQGLFQAAN